MINAVTSTTKKRDISDEILATKNFRRRSATNLLRYYIFFKLQHITTDFAMDLKSVVILRRNSDGITKELNSVAKS